MRRLPISILTTALLGATLAAAPAVAHDACGEAEGPQFLFVLSSTSGSVDGDVLTLADVPNVIVFSDRPERFTGHLENSDLVPLWALGDDSFEDDPPNAVLSVIDHEHVEDVVIELTDIAVDEAGVHFDFIELMGTLPDGAIGTASLFIDGAPLLPDTITIPDLREVDIFWRFG